MINEVNNSVNITYFIKRYFLFTFLSFIFFLIFFFLLNSFYLKKNYFLIQANATVLSLPKFNMQEVSSVFYNETEDSGGLSIFYNEDQYVNEKSYKQYQRNALQKAKGIPDILLKLQNLPEAFVNFLKLDISFPNNEKYNNSILYDTLKVIITHNEEGLITYKNISISISGLNQDVTEYLDNKIVNSYLLLKKYIAAELSYLKEELELDNGLKRKQLFDSLTLRMHHLQEQITIAKENNIKNPDTLLAEIRVVDDTLYLRDSTEYLKGYFILGLEYDQIQKELLDINNGTHYLLSKDKIVLENLEKFALFNDILKSNEDNLEPLFFYKNKFNKSNKTINPILVTYFVYFLIFYSFFIISLIIIHLYFIDKKILKL